MADDCALNAKEERSSISRQQAMQTSVDYNAQAALPLPLHRLVHGDLTFMYDYQDSRINKILIACFGEVERSSPQHCVPYVSRLRLSRSPFQSNSKCIA